MCVSLLHPLCRVHELEDLMFELALGVFAAMCAGASVDYALQATPWYVHGGLAGFAAYCAATVALNI